MYKLLSFILSTTEVPRKERYNFYFLRGYSLLGKEI